MSSQEVSNQIIRSFKVVSFVVLGCDSSGHNLIRCADQSLDREKLWIEKVLSTSANLKKRYKYPLAKAIILLSK